MIGIASVSLTVGLGQGAQNQVREQINALGSNLLIVSPGSSTSGGVRGGFGSATTLARADAEALADPSVAPGIGAVAPATTMSQSLVTYGDRQTWASRVTGSTPAWQTGRARTLAGGRSSLMRTWTSELGSWSWVEHRGELFSVARERRGVRSTPPPPGDRCARRGRIVVELVPAPCCTTTTW